MAKYKLSGDGVFDTEKNHFIPNDTANRHWQDYQEWLAVPNTPDPEFTLPEIKANAKIEAERMLDEKIQADVVFDTDSIKADKKHKDDICWRVYSRDKAKEIKIKKADGSLKTIIKGDIDAMMIALGDRDDLVFDAYEICYAAIDAAIDEAGVLTALATFAAT